MRKKYILAAGLAAIVGVMTYQVKQDDSNPTSPIESIFPSYEEIMPTPTCSPTQEIKSVKDITTYNIDKILQNYK